MPPIPNYFLGHERIREFLVRDPLRERWKHHPAAANGQLAVGCYLYSPDQGSYLPAVIDVLTLDGERIAAVTGFLVPEIDVLVSTGPVGTAPGGTRATGAEIFARFGLPAELPGP